MIALRRRSHLARACVIAAGLLVTLTAPAYVISGTSWPSGDVRLQLQLGAPASTLLDGAVHWDDVALAAVNRWNQNLGRARLVGTKNSTAARGSSNGYNNVFFDSSIYGDAFGDRVLAVTLRRSQRVNTIEADVVVNSGESWNSYRGSLRSGTRDLERVLLHEFGHVLGLGHPDDDEPPQAVPAIMNSRIGNAYALQPDDIAGANALYGSGVAAPTGVTLLRDQTLTAGSPLTLSYTASGSDLRYLWSFTPTGGTERELLNGDGEPWPGAAFSLFAASPSDSGLYSVQARNSGGVSAVSSARVAVTRVSTTQAVLANISARGRAGAGSETFIVGFVITGSTPKSVLVRAVGPTLGSHGVARPLADPALSLFRSSGSTSTAVGTNDNWSAEGSAAASLRDTAQRLGAFALPAGSKDAAMLMTLPPGIYSAHVNSVGGGTGITLVEVYDADASLKDSLTHKLVNLSTRSYAGTGEEQLIAGFVIDGTTPKQVLIRAVGPGLAIHGVQNINTDPNLVLFKGSAQIADNDDWAFSNQTPILPAAFTTVGTSQLGAGSYDSALLITLQPGVYSATASGRSGETGVVLLEVFELPD